MLSIESWIIIFALVLASLEDLHIREVPDVLSYTFILSGVMFSIHSSVIQGSFMPLLSSLGGIIVSFLFGYLLMHAQMWGGGDTKLLMGLGAFIGVWPEYTSLAMLVFLIFMAGSVYGLLWTVVLIVRKWSEITERDSELKRVSFGVLLSLVLTSVVLSWYTEGLLRVVVIVSIVLLSLTLFTGYVLRRMEDVLIVQSVPTTDLVPGDWLIETVETENGVVEPRSVGMSEEDIAMVQASDTDYVSVKYGLPFIPSFLFGYILYIITMNAGVV